jgi:hypothetical protein
MFLATLHVRQTERRIGYRILVIPPLYTVTPRSEPLTTHTWIQP